jgi:hypothetical protein
MEVSWLRCDAHQRTDIALVINLASTPLSFDADKAKSDTRFGYASKSQANKVQELSPVSELPHSSTVDVVASEPEKPSSALPAPCRKVVSFSEDLVQTLLFDCEAPASDLGLALDVKDGWTPLKIDRPYLSRCQTSGLESMFVATNLQTITLKAGVIARFKAVQEYEKRRKQDSVPAGEHSALGQLEYGNADSKLALQPTSVITANDIGTFKDTNELSVAVSTCSWLTGPLLHFGGFQDEFGRSFEDAQIPCATIAAYKKPIDWDSAHIAQHRLANWVRTAFGALQPGDLAK